jgi:multidrug resistance efflux pump
MAEVEIVEAGLVERELELVAREAELNRREATVRRAEELREDDEVRLSLLERREREVDQMRDALDAQRARLDEVRAEYESRREVLRKRTVELEGERDRLRHELARVQAEGIVREQPEPLAEAAAVAAVEVGTDWWSKQLGTPLEAA